MLILLNFYLICGSGWHGYKKELMAMPTTKFEFVLEYGHVSDCDI